MNQQKWWMPEYGFFGDFYMEGDDSINGYLEGKQQTLSQRVETEVDGIVKLLNLKQEQTILDLPCGYGRHSIELAKRGYNVVGCDINEVHLNHAKEKGKQYSEKLTFCTGNMLDFTYRFKFDAIINMFYSFGFFETDEDNLATLRNFYNNLKPGGHFLFHTDVNMERVISGKYREYEERTLSSGKKLTIIDKYEPSTRRMNGKWIIQDDQTVLTQYDYSVRVYDANEFVNMCKSLNFANIQVYGDWDGSSFSENTEDMIVIAQK